MRGLGLRLAEEGQPTTVVLMLKEPGEYLFSCGMGLLRGLLIIEVAS